MADETRHPIIADTDALIAVANTSLWPIIRDTLTITTTNVCIQELIFCEACAELLRGEGWTGYKAVQAAWEAIPVDCDDVIDDELLPE